MERTKKPFRRELKSINFTTGEATFKEPTILTNDPSITAWGWAVLNVRGEILNCGCIKTAPEQKKRRIRKSDDTGRRATEIIQKLINIIQAHNVKYLLSESPHGSQNASAAVMIGMVTGIIYTLSECLAIPLETYSEGDSKKNALGKLSAAKNEMIERMSELFSEDWKTGTKYIDEAVADALGVYYVASKQSTTLKMMKR
jgi:Holliday junction resolvasome RuvABC endonuclease subunit